jgi:hypothetical protein
MIRAISALPATIFDMTEKGRKTLIQRRMLGERSIYWHGQSPRSIVSSHIPENTPFFVVLLGEGEPVAEYMDWSAKNGDKPTIVAEKGAHLSYPDLTLNGLKERLLAVCDRLGSAILPEDAAEAKSLIAQWQAFDKRALGYKVGGHNSVAPNVHVLESMGFTDISYGPLGVSFEIQPHVNQIVQTTRSIFAERDRLGANRLARFFKPTFELNLFSPAIYPDVLNMNVPTSLGTEERDRLIVARRLLQEQTGYSYSSRSPTHAQAILGIDRVHIKKSKFSPPPLFRLRQEELWLGTACMIGFAVSEASAVARLPNAVNRTSGAVHNFAEHYRSKSPVTRKRLRAFQEVQRSIAKAVPSEFVDLIREARTGVRIVADAHLEWLDIDGLPLGIRKDVTRIPVTPASDICKDLLALWSELDPFRERQFAWGFADWHHLAPETELPMRLKVFCPLYLSNIIPDYVDIDSGWDGLIVLVKDQFGPFADEVKMPLFLRWRLEHPADEASLARNVVRHLAEAIQQIPVGEAGILYIGFLDSLRPSIADRRTETIVDAIPEFGYAKRGVIAPMAQINRLYPHVMDHGMPDLIESAIPATQDRERALHRYFPTLVFTRGDGTDDADTSSTL